MNDKTIITAVLVDETSRISLVDVCEQYHLSEALLREMLDHGFFGQTSVSITNLEFDNLTLRRIQSAQRLQQDLDINLPGVILALELLDELDQLRDELNILQRHVKG